MAKKIALLEHLGGGNLGDDATLDAVMQNIRRRWSDVKLAAFCMNPDDARSRHGIPSYPICQRTWQLGDARAKELTVSFKQRVKLALGKYPSILKSIAALNALTITQPRRFAGELRFLRRSFRVLRSFDFLVICGGGQLTDFFGGTWTFPYTIFKWTLLAKWAHVPCLVINVGAGPLNRPLSRRLIRSALSFCTYVSFRDQDSRELVRQLGFRRSTQVFPDNVYGLDEDSVSPRAFQPSAEAVVGIAPIPYCDPRSYYPKKDQFAYQGFIERLGRFGSWLLDDGYRLSLFGSDIGTDLSAVADLQNALTGLAHLLKTESISVPSVRSIQELLQAIARMDFVVTCRFHGVVFAHLLNKPVIALSHHPKMTRLMRDLGLSDYCFDLGKLDLTRLKEAFSCLVLNREEIKKRLAERLTDYKDKLDNQFNELFPRAQLPS